MIYHEAGVFGQAQLVTLIYQISENQVAHWAYCMTRGGIGIYRPGVSVTAYGIVRRRVHGTDFSVEVA